MLDVKRHVERYQQKKYETFVYNHKTKPDKND